MAGTASDCEFPTILHFAAKYDLSRLCRTLMKYPGYKTARVMTNKDGMTPSDLALTAGHESLSEKIRVGIHILKIFPGAHGNR